MPRYFTRDHEWIDIDGEAATVGITAYAQEQLGDITFVDTPVAGRTVTRGDSVCVVDSVKAASDVFAPVSGTVLAGNADLAEQPELVNGEAEGAGWLWRMTLSDVAELDGLMDAAAYAAYVETL